MPKVPSYRQKRLPSTNVGQAPAQSANLAGEAVGQGMASFGNSLFRLGQQMDAVNTAEDIAQGLAEYSEEMNRYKESLVGKDPSEYMEQDANGEYVLPKDLLARLNKVGEGKTRRAQQAIQNRMTILNESSRHEIASQMASDKSALLVAKFDRIAASHAMNPDTGEAAMQEYFAGMEGQVKPSVLEGLKDRWETLRDKTHLQMAKQVKEQSIDNIKPSIVKTLQSGDTWQNDKRFSEQDKRNALETIEKELNQLQESGALTETEKLEAQKDLNNWMDNYAEEYKADEKKKDERTTTQLYDDYVSRLVNGTLRADEIQESDLKKPEKDTWRQVMLGSYNDPPEKTDFEGYKNAKGVILRYSSGALSKKDAYDSLLQSRYVDTFKTPEGKDARIKDDLFRQSVQLIQNPLPKDFAQSLSGEMDYIEELSKGRIRFSEGEKQRAIEINTSLLNWAIRESKDSSYPSGKEIHAKASELHMKSLKSVPDEANKLYDLGDIEIRNGVEYEIVGFDIDGMPLVEEAK